MDEFSADWLLKHIEDIAVGRSDICHGYKCGHSDDRKFNLANRNTGIRDALYVMEKIQPLVPEFSVLVEILNS